MSEPVDHMAAWRALGNTADGLRKLMIRMYHQRGLESYAAYSLSAAAARMEQLEAALQSAGVSVPEPVREDETDSGIKVARVMFDAEYPGRDVSRFVWAQYGDEAKQAMIAHFTAPPASPSPPEPPGSLR